MAMGRPLKEGAELRHDLKVRVDDETFSALIEFCQKENAERAEVIRKALKRYLAEQERDV